MKNSVPKPKPKRPLRKQVWHLRVYMADETPASQAAIANLKRICENNPKLRYRIEVIELMAQPHFAEDDRIWATPTPMRKRPQPRGTIIGDLSNTERVLLVLDLRLVDYPRAQRPFLTKGHRPHRPFRRNDAPQ